MAIYTTADGRQIVGAAQAGNEYKGYAGRREIVIQLTETGATQDSLDALEFLKSYAVYQNSVGKPIFPASTNVFISNNGVTKAVEADEVTVDGANVNIGGCVWNGTAWDFTNAGQGGGGSSGGGVLVVHETISEGTHTLDKTWKQLSDAADAGTIIYYIIQGGYDDGHIMYADRIVYDGVAYCAYFSNPGGTINAYFESETENGYPSYTA